MTREHFSEIVEAQLYAHRHALLDDEVGRAITTCLKQKICDDFTRNELLRRVERHKLAQAFTGPFQVPKLQRGQELRGHDLRGNPICTPVMYRSGNSLTLAGSGGGKSIKAKHTALQIAPYVKGMWCFDFRKREYEELIPPLRELQIDMLSTTIHKVRYNILEVPEGVNPLDYSSRLSESLISDLQLPPRASKLLHAMLLKLYRVHGILDGSLNFPHLGDLYTSIRDNKEANPQARQAIIDSLEPVLLSLGHEVLGVRRGWKTSELADRFIHFDFSGAAETDKLLIMNNLLLSEFMARIAKQISNPKHIHLYITLDEAGSLISSSNPNSGLLDLFSLIRGTGLSIELGTQYADIHPAILSNTSNKTLGRCGSSRDYEVMGSAIGLNTEQQTYIRHHLRPGVFIEQVGEGSWRYPYIVSIPYERQANKETHHNSTTNELDNIPVDYEPLSWPFDDVGLPATISTEHKESGNELTLPELRFLEAIVMNPGQPSSVYTKLARIGGNQAKKFRAHLLEQGYLREHKVNTNSRGRSSIILEPLQPVFAAVNDNRREQGEQKNEG